MTGIASPEQLVASFAATAQNRAVCAVLERRIDDLRAQLECCTQQELAALQGAVGALRALQRLLSGLHE